MEITSKAAAGDVVVGTVVEVRRLAQEIDSTGIERKRSR